MTNKIEGYSDEFYQTHQLKKEQRRWQKAFDVPRDTAFCPLAYSSCCNVSDDTNCFSIKAPGCYTFRKYVQNKNPRALVTREYALDYLENNIEDIIKEIEEAEDAKRDKV